VANLRDLRQRITSVGNIQKITRAMEMVATTKLRRFQERAVAARPYSGEIAGLVQRLSSSAGADLPEDTARLFRRGREDAPVWILFVGSDRGLCGAYNTNAGRRLDQEAASLEAEGRSFEVLAIGRKAVQHAHRKGYPVRAFLEDLSLEKLDFQQAARVSRMLVQGFLGGQTCEVRLCYTRFVSMMKYMPRVDAFLPVAPAEQEDTGLAPDLILEPDAPTLLGRLIPRYLETSVFHALLESVTSEYASRRFAMKNATDAAGEMKAEITRDYNKARQAKITSEILEIVSGAEAL